MRSTAWAAGLLMAACTMSGADAADSAERARHHRYAHNPRGSIGQCVRTSVAGIGNPVGAPGQPPGIVYRDGVIQEFDGGMLGHTETRPGDPIQLCLVSFTRDCGDEDLRGRTYATGNLRTGAAWTLPDIRSSCEVK